MQPLAWRTKARRGWQAAIAASVMIAGLGCGGPTPAEPEGARVVLEQTLDAWRDGQASAHLSGPAEGVRVGDPKWEGGYRLVRYEIGPEPRPEGLDVRFTVSLSMLDPKGAAVDETAHYTVSTQPARTVIRSAF